MGDVQAMKIAVKRKSKKPSGYEVELKEDGHYYVSAVPKKSKSVGIGDRVLEINGIAASEFKSEKHAIDIFDTLNLELIPAEGDESEEEEEESSEEEEEEEMEPPPPSPPTSAGTKPKKKRIVTVYSPSQENWKKVDPKYKLNGK